LGLDRGTHLGQRSLHRVEQAGHMIAVDPRVNSLVDPLEPNGPSTHGPQAVLGAELSLSYLSNFSGASSYVDRLPQLAAWQNDFDAVRRRQRLRLGGLVSRRLWVLPRWCAFMHLSFGPAFVFLSHIYVDHRILDAPAAEKCRYEFTVQRQPLKGVHLAPGFTLTGAIEMSRSGTCTKQKAAF